MPCHKLRGKAESKRHSMIRGKMYLTVLVLFCTEKSQELFLLCVGQDKQSYVVLILLSPPFV